MSECDYCGVDITHSLHVDFVFVQREKPYLEESPIKVFGYCHNKDCKNLHKNEREREIEKIRERYDNEDIEVWEVIDG